MARSNTLAGLALLGAVVLAACSDSPTQPPQPFLGCSDVRPHTIGTTVTGVLTATSCLYLDDPTNFYEFRLTQQGTVTISLNSTDADAFLFLFDRASNGVIDLDDDSGGGPDDTNARIVQTLPAGTYVIGATTWDGTTGSYTLITSR